MAATRHVLVLAMGVRERFQAPPVGAHLRLPLLLVQLYQSTQSQVEARVLAKVPETTPNTTAHMPPHHLSTIPKSTTTSTRAISRSR
jgi:hypothetical protein